MSDLPNHAYYRACQGSWRSPLALQVTDAAALATSGMSWTDRLGMRALAAWPRWLGALTLDTTVDYDPGGVVAHTTVVRWRGVPLMTSAETLVLDPDGRRFTLTGAQRVAPAAWVARPVTGRGEVGADGQTAVYELAWFGVWLRQATVREDDVVTLTQDGPGFTGAQRLVRRGRR